MRGSVLQCAAVCYSVSQCVTMCRNVLMDGLNSTSFASKATSCGLRVAVCGRELQRVAACCSVLQCVAEYYSVLQFAAVF